MNRSVTDLIAKGKINARDVGLTAVQQIPLRLGLVDLPPQRQEELGERRRIGLESAAMDGER